MTQRCVRILARVLLVFAALATTAGVSALSAQSTGKIEGHIKDAQGAPIPNARVIIVGTSFSAPVNPQGYYFIENIPAGLVSVRATYVGYKPTQQDGVRVLSGQTLTLDFALESTPVQLADITVTTAKQALVPRDVVSTKQIITGDMVQKLPVDRIQQALALQPGVVQVSVCGSNLPCNPTISVRGGRVDQNATVIDGVPVNNGIHTGAATSIGQSIGNAPGAPVLSVATNAFEDASVTTGASSASMSGAQAGIINISTRTGGNKLSGSLGYETGLLGLSYYGQGLNIFSGSVGGPIGRHLTFFVSGRVEGNNSTNGGSHGWLFPGYARVSLDTTFRVANFGHAGLAAAGAAVDSINVPVYNYATTFGGCTLPASQGGFQGANFAPMAANYGATCHANQQYTAPSTNYFTTDKLAYTFGQGSRLSLSYLYSGNQNIGSGSTPLQDGYTQGSITGANVATLNWTQTLIREATHQLTLDAYISRQWSNSLNGRLTAASQAGTQSSPGGFITKKLKFVYNPKDFPVDSQLIYHILENTSNVRIGITDPKNTAQYVGLGTFNQDMPPDGVGYSAGGNGGDPNSGGGALSYTNENRWLGIANIDFQADRYNRLKIGGQYTGYDITDYTSNTSGGGVFTGKPVAYDGYAEDRVDLGDVVLVAGVRYDYYWSKAWRWNEFPEISSRSVPANSGGPARSFSPDSLFCPVGSQPSSQAVCALVQDPSHNYLSPHLQVSFPVTDKTNFRLSYAQNVQAPDFGLIYDAAQFDINVSGQNQRGRWGGDLDFGKTVTFEFGARHAFSDDMVLDVSVYNNDIVANPSFQFEHPINPVTQQPALLYLIENTDFGNTRGIDLRLDRRIGNYFNGSLTYSFQDSKNTGTDPFSYLGFFEPATGFGGALPTAALPTGSSRPQSLTALFNLQLPGDWKKGSVLGAVLKRTGFFVTGRVASGLAYTQCNSTDQGSIGVVSSAPFGGLTAGNAGTSCVGLSGNGGFNASRLPMLKQLDLRLTKDFRLGKYQLTGYLDARNLLDIQNIFAVWSQTGTTTSAANSKRLYSIDSATFAIYGTGTGERQADGSLKLPASTAACALVISGPNSYAPECYYMIRSEQRFGNGDGIYTLAEQRAASDSHWALANSPYNFIAGARTIRFGLEVTF